MDERKWVPNFVPNSSARKIVDWLLQSQESDQPFDKDQLSERLARFKQETGLEEIDLLQLREYAEFEARLVSHQVNDPQRVIRHQLAETSLQLAVERGIGS